MKRKKLWRVLRALLIIYITGGIVLYFLQDLIIFHPKPLARDYNFNFKQPFKELNLSPDDNRNLNIVQFLPKEKSKGIVLYFHGNKINIERYAQYAPVFTKNNYEVWMIDYPGYGKSTGKRSEQTMYDDALFLYQLAIKKTSAENIILYGKSLGTGVASYLATVIPCRQLILDTPYNSMTSMTRHYVPIYPAGLLRYSFPGFQYLKKVNAPVTIFHGTSDEVIPYSQSMKLKKELPRINLITVLNGKHNNLYRFPRVIQKLDSLLAG
jgi:alpha-beta hydrolase superfamily lysophospholipase